MKGRLNLFQASMLRWRALHPYNAVHAMTLQGDPDPGRLREAIGRTLEAWGLTGLALDATRGRYEWRGGPAQVELRVVPGEADGPAAALEREIGRELNHRYPEDGALEPFRFFAVPGEGAFRLALGYDHFVAAGDSIVALMRSIEHAWRERRVDRDRPAERYPERCAPMLARNAAAVARGLPQLREMIASCRRSVRPRYPHGTDGTNAFLLAELDEAGSAQLRATARSRSVTLNDALLAAGLLAVAPFAGARDASRRRHEIGAASIMNIRRDFRGAGDAFGQFLSSFRVSHPLPPGATLGDVAADVHRETEVVKRRRLHLLTLLAMGASGAAWRFMDDRQRRGVHARSYPTWIGISNLDVNALWRQGDGGAAPDYVRAVPTGPLSPVVVAVTSTGPRIRLGFSFRTAAFGRDDIARMASLFIELCRRSPE